MNTIVKTYLFIYIGTIFYVIASYFHLSIKKWNLKQAYLIAIPLVMVEYYFSLNGNHDANQVLKLNPLQILLVTMSFYFINTWLLNYFVIKNDIILWRELLSFILIISAFYVSTNINRKNIL